MQTREEHLAASKERALKYLEKGDVNNALTSMMCDMDKHPDTVNHCGNEICIGLLMVGGLGTVEEARRFINGYN